MWISPTEFQEELGKKGYLTQFVNTNSIKIDCQEKYVLVYACNKFLNPIIKNFLLRNGISIDEDEYALSEMLQWIFRSRIKEKKSIWIYIPSPRMKKLLEDWE